MTKYEELSDILLKKFQNNEIGKKLPTEKKLSEEYNLSINTARSALALLKKRGLIVSKQGSGYYFIVDNELNENAIGLGSLKSSFPRKNVETKVLAFELKKATGVEAENLGIKENVVIYKIKRLRFVDHKPLIIENTIIPYELLPDLKESYLQTSLYNYIEDVTSVKISQAIKEISAVNLSSKDAKLVDLATTDPVLLVKNKGFLKNGTQFEYSENYHLGEYFKVIVN